MNDFLEKDLETIIYENRDIVVSRGFCDLSWGKLERQLRLPSSGIVDLIIHDDKTPTFKCKVIELKRGEIDVSALLQGIAYYEDMVRIGADTYSSCEISLVLCGRSISDAVMNISKIANNLELYEYNYGFNGISFMKREVIIVNSKNDMEDQLMKAV